MLTTLLAAVITAVSPNGRNAITLDDANGLVYSVSQDGKTRIVPSAIGFEVENFPFSGKIASSEPFECSGKVKTPIYKKAEIDLAARGIRANLGGGYGIELIARDDGVAYRMITAFEMNEVLVKSECADVIFSSGDVQLWAGYPVVFTEVGGKLHLSNWESVYTNLTAAAAGKKRDEFAELPLVAVYDDGCAISISESDQRDYPGWLLRGSGKPAQLRGEFAAEPIEAECKGPYHHQNLRRHDYLAKTAGKRTYPWRVFMIADGALELASSDAVYALAEPCKLADTSWIRPGLAQWEWWHDWSLTGVDFRAGKNTKTYFYYIDFAAEHKVPYIIIDGGWSKDYEIMNAIPEIDLKAITAYAKQKGVSVILWSPWASFAERIEEACRAYAEIGIAGFKLDGICRNDRYLTKYLEDVARIAAKYHQVIDYHGVSKPSGLSRTYPNVLSYEGVHGLENTKWQLSCLPVGYDFPQNDLTSLYCRMTAGPMDYTPGAMRNFTKKGYHYNYSEPGSQGTRVRQMALFTLYESPLQMLCDSPTLYRKNAECFEFMCKVPTVWDEMRPLTGKIGEYAALARRAGEVWYVGAITDWNARKLTIKTDFLAPGNWQVEIFEDGINADRNATDYRRTIKTIHAGEIININLAPGGGWTARFSRQ